MSQLMAGRTPETARAWARAARKLALSCRRAPRRRSARVVRSAWVRDYAQQRDLVWTPERGRLRHVGHLRVAAGAGDRLAQGAGFPAGHTVGIRTVRDDGRITTKLEGCGGFPDGSNQATAYVDGKRCWVSTRRSSESVPTDPAALQPRAGGTAARRSPPGTPTRT